MKNSPRGFAAFFSPAITLLVFGCANVHSAHAATWQMLAAKSKLEFVGKYQGEAFTGQFQKFTPSIVFDDKDLAKSKLDVSIDMGSANSKDGDRDSTLLTSDFFWHDKFPKARFVTQAIRATGPNQYQADAILTIRDKSRKIAFPFTFTPNKTQARLQAKVKLNRTVFDVGVGDWADASIIAHEVDVVVDLQLLATKTPVATPKTPATPVKPVAAKPSIKQPGHQ